MSDMIPGATEDDLSQLSDGEIAARAQVIRAREIRKAFSALGDMIERFNERGGMVNVTVLHNGGSEGIELHQLNGEFEPEFFLVERVDVGDAGQGAA